MSREIVVKATADTIDYDIDFEPFLDNRADALSSVEATISGGTATVLHSQIINKIVKVWIDGGTDGETAEVEVIAHTAGGRTKQFCFRLRIKECV